MDREEFYQIGLAKGWLSTPDVCDGISEVDRGIAVKAIAARATGTPAEAAAQILSGIAALDAGPLNPVVVRWPQEFGDHDYLVKRAEWHESERVRLIAKAASSKETSEKFWAGINTNPSQFLLEDPLQSPKASAPQAFPKSPQHQEQQCAASESRDEESQEGRRHPAGAPARVPSDES